MSSEIQILTAFKTSAKSFLDELISTFPNEQDLVLLRVLLTSDSVPITELVNHFIHKVLPQKQLIEARDESFFTKNPSLFGSFSSKDTLRNLWTSGRLSRDNKEVIWQWFDLFVKLSEKCVKIRSS